MKPTTPPDPRNVSFDDLIAAALHGDLSPAERAHFESRLQTDPAAAAAYQETQAMHDLLEKTNRSAQPDPDFEQRMVSGVRRKLAQPAHRETAWESLVILWRLAFPKQLGFGWIQLAMAVGVIAILACVVLSAGSARLSGARRPSGVFSTITNHLPVAKDAEDRVMLGSSQVQLKELDSQRIDALETKKREVVEFDAGAMHMPRNADFNNSAPAGYIDPSMTTTTPQGGTVRGSGFAPPASAAQPATDVGSLPTSSVVDSNAGTVIARSGEQSDEEAVRVFPYPRAKPVAASNAPGNAPAATATEQAPGADADFVPRATGRFSDSGNQMPDTAAPMAPVAPPPAQQYALNEQQQQLTDKLAPDGIAQLVTTPSAPPPSADNRKLIRNAQLDLEVKSFQAAFDQITVLTKGAGGYVDTSNSQRGGNGKLQGAVVVKILPQNLDAFLLKLRDLGDVQNQSVSTDDVTKDYYDTQARLVNSQKMEVQLQDLLKRENGKVSDLLAVERELGRVRGDIEQMQGQLKLYDFQVQYATVTMNLAEKDLNQTAAYLLKEQDNFSLFATDVEGTFAKARQAADQFKAQVLAADLQHNSGSDISASLDVMVAPDQIEPFLAQIRGLGRVANFTRQTQRVAKDGGDSSNPADETLTEKDKVRVMVSIRSDDDSREQVALTVVAKAVDDALDQAKAAALAQTGVEILSSSLNKTPDGASTAQLSVRVPGRQYAAVIDAFRALGRASSLTIQRRDNSGPGATGDDTPVIVSLALTDAEVPVQTTDLAIVTADVDEGSQQIKKDAADAGVEVKASSFQGQPNGTHLARLTLFLPIGKYPDYIETLKKLGRVQSLSVQRNDASGPDAATEDAPVAISLALTDDDPPVQETQLVVVADDVDGLSQQIKKDAAAAGAEVKESNFGQEPDGTAHAQMTLRIPMGRYPAYLESLKKTGKVEALSVQREDRPGLPAADESAPAEISLQLHNERAIVANNGGLWPALRQMFGEGLDALLGSVQVIGVLIAFLAPWVFTLVLFAWIGRRIYVWRKSR